MRFADESTPHGAFSRVWRPFDFIFRLCFFLALVFCIVAIRKMHNESARIYCCIREKDSIHCYVHPSFHCPLPDFFLSLLYLCYVKECGGILGSSPTTCLLYSQQRSFLIPAFSYIGLFYCGCLLHVPFVLSEKRTRLFLHHLFTRTIQYPFLLCIFTSLLICAMPWLSEKVLWEF